MGTKKQRKIEKRQLADLQPHSEQAIYFPDLSEGEMQMLIASIKAEGIKHPPEVLADNTILDGVHRCKAARALGWDTIEVVVRYDLDGASQDQIRAEFLRPNLCRRQLSKLQQARAALGLLEAENKVNRKAGRGDLRDAIGELIGMSGRNLDRYWTILKTPIEVQQAFEAKRLQVKPAVAVASLPKPAQGMIARRIRKGEAPAVVVGEYLTPGTPKPREASKPQSDEAALARFSHTVEAGVEDLTGRLADLTLGEILPHLATLRDAVQLLSALIETAERHCRA